MKVLFLDHFGVMCLANKHDIESKWDQLPRFSEMRVHGNFDAFDTDAIKVLNSILQDTDIEIVVSSDWKCWTDLESMSKFYLLQGIIKAPIDFTPNFELLSQSESFKKCLLRDIKFKIQKRRTFEILSWLESHPGITNWVAIDDMHLGKLHHNWGLENFVWVSKSDQGIKQEGIKNKILNFLN